MWAIQIGDVEDKDAPVVHVLYNGRDHYFAFSDQTATSTSVPLDCEFILLHLFDTSNFDEHQCLGTLLTRSLVKALVLRGDPLIEVFQVRLFHGFYHSFRHSSCRLSTQSIDSRIDSSSYAQAAGKGKVSGFCIL